MKVRTFILILTFTFMHSVSAFNQVETDKRYINGYLYAETFPGTIAYPFFLSENWYMSELSMDGRQYEDLALRYDLYRDQVLYNHIHPSGSYIIVLNKELIDAFAIDGHRFKKLPDSGHISAGMKEGYYELLAEGKASFYVKWQKRLSDPGPDSRAEFTLIKEWYILNDGEFKRVSGKSGILKVLEDHKKEVKSFIRKNRIVLISGKEPEVKRIIDYYNSLEP